jgi:hypothetical protein
MHISKYAFGFLFSLLLLQGCGGGGGGGTSPVNNIPAYAGLTTEATIDTANSRDLTTAAASGSLQAVIADGASTVLSRSTPSLEAKLLEVSPLISKWLAQTGGAYAARTTNVSELCDAGGTAIADTNDAETIGTITFTNCGISDGTGSAIVLNGTVDFTYVTSTDSISMVYHVTVSYAGESQAINMTVACVDFMTSSPTCTVSSDFTGLDSRVYRITDISVSGNASSGFYINATIYDPDSGRFDMTTSVPILFDCPTAGIPSTGVIGISGSGGTSASISFDDCSSFTVTINGVPETYNW